MNPSSAPPPMHQRRNNGASAAASAASSSSQGTGHMYNNNNSNNKNRRSYDLEGGGGAHRGVGGGSGRGGGTGGRAAPHGDTNANILEQQNNDRISLLSDQVSRLKGLTIDIGNEVREQNTLLDGMGDGFHDARDLLNGSLRRISTMLESGGMKHMCYMVAFCILAMIFLWWLMSYQGTSGA